MSVRYEIQPWSWRPLQTKAMDDLDRILREWKDTPYISCGTEKGVGVDCVRFVCAVLDEWFGQERVDLDRLPPDTAMHNRAGAVKTMRKIVRRYEPVEDVLGKDNDIYPGDVIVVGGAGPGHAMIVGAQRNTLWQSSLHGVHYTGIALAVDHEHLFAHFRIQETLKWQLSSSS